MCAQKDKGKEKKQGKDPKRKRKWKGKLCPPKGKGKEKKQGKDKVPETPQF